MSETQTQKKDENPRAYLLKGDDDYRKQQDLEKLIKFMVAENFIDFDLEQMEGDSATAERIMSGLGIPSFGAMKRVVLVKYANKMPTDEQEKLASQLNRIPPSSCLVLVTPAAEKVDGKTKKGAEVIGALSKAVKAVGEIREYGKLKSADAETAARSLFAKVGKKIDPGTLKLFIQRVGTDSAIIAGEVQKLADYTEGVDFITADDVEKVTSETPEEKVFKIIDAAAARNQAAAMRYMNELFEAGDNPDADAPKALATISRNYRLLWQMKCLQEMGIKNFAKSSVPDDIKSMLPSDPNILDVLSRQPWMSQRLSKQAGSMSRQELIRCFNALAEADLRLKGIEGDIENPKLIMELLIIELSRRN